MSENLRERELELQATMRLQQACTANGYSFATAIKWAHANQDRSEMSLVYWLDRATDNVSEGGTLQL